jgi:3-dehydroquinate synthase class II
LSRANNLFVEVDHLKGGQTALSILEKGVDGVVVNHPDPDAVRQIVQLLKSKS